MCLCFIFRHSNLGQSHLNCLDFDNYQIINLVTNEVVSDSVVFAKNKKIIFVIY